MVFYLLVDEKPDSKGHSTHLNITAAQRTEHINDIDITFGNSLTDKNNKSWTVASAYVLLGDVARVARILPCLDRNT